MCVCLNIRYTDPTYKETNTMSFNPPQARTRYQQALRMDTGKIILGLQVVIAPTPIAFVRVTNGEPEIVHFDWTTHPASIVAFKESLKAKR